MSRSYKKTPIFGHTTCKSEKEDKRINNRTFRSRERELINMERYDDCPIKMNEVRSVWSMGKDGKSYWNNPSADMYDYFKKIMRK